MSSFNTARALLFGLTVAMIAGAPGLESLARPRPAPVVAEPPPPPPPAGPVGLPDRMIQEAAAYDSFMRGAVSISPAFDSASSVQNALGRARAYEASSLVRGAVAYAAIAALQDQGFIASLRAAGNTPEHRTQMAGYILANPAYVYGFTDSQVAAGLAREALGPRALWLYANGKSVRKAAYDIQKQGWSKSLVNDLPGRLAAAEAAATAAMLPEAGSLADQRRSVTGPDPLPIVAPPLAPPYPPLVAQALQLAAIAALGEAGEDSYDRLSPLLAQDEARGCLGAAKRNFHQCLAVAKPNYEDVFCIGQHALMDTGACMAKAAGYEPPPDAPPPPPIPALRATHKHRHAA